MENSIVYRDGGFTVYRNVSYRGFSYIAFKGEKIGEFRTVEQAKKACRVKNKDWEKMKLMLIGAGISWIPVILKSLLDRGPG